MNAKDAIRSSAGLSTMVLKSYISDLSDADLMCRPADGCNHLAWQLGHLIASEIQLLGMVGAEQVPELPAGFAEAHSKEACGNDDPTGFHDKQTYEALFDQVRAGSLAALEAYPEADLDKPSPETLGGLCPTMGDLFALVANHPLMHAGQFAVVRRKLGKPILI
jgi:hypothetical protein